MCGYIYIERHGRRWRGKEDEEWRGVPSQGSNIHNFDPAVPLLLSQASQIAVQHRLCLTQTSTLHLEAKHDRKKSNNISTTSPPPPMASLPAGNLNSSWLSTQRRDSQRVCLRKRGEHTSRTRTTGLELEAAGSVPYLRGSNKVSWQLLFRWTRLWNLFICELAPMWCSANTCCQGYPDDGTAHDGCYQTVRLSATEHMNHQ